MEDQISRRALKDPYERAANAVAAALASSIVESRTPAEYIRELASYDSDKYEAMLKDALPFKLPF